MQRIAKILEKRNPDQAARLRMAWQRSKDDRNLERIAEIENLLKERYFADAVERQKQLEATLARLLDILLDRDAERKDLQDKVDRFEALSQKLGKLIQEERDHYLKSEKFADPEKTLQRAAAAKARLKNLIRRQSELIGRTQAPGRKAAAAVAALQRRLDDLIKQQAGLRGAKNADAQKEISKKAGELATAIAEHAQALPDAMKKDRLGRANPADLAADAVKRAATSMEQAAGAMQAGKAFDRKQAAAEQDLAEAADALRRLAKRHQKQAENELAADQERIRKDTARLRGELDRLRKSAEGQDSGAGEVGQAGKRMEQAGKGLQRGERGKALPKQKEALQKLQEAQKKLEAFEKELKRLIKLPDYEKLAKGQEKTTEKTDDLLKKMKQAGGPQPAPQGQPGEPTPGQQGVEGAKKAMQRAQRNLHSRSAKRANSDQKEAVERLQKAREELEEDLRQLREEEQLMLLDALNRRLARMLRTQTSIFKQTLALDIRLKDARGKPPRALLDKGRRLGDGEAGLSAEAEKILDILREEGTTVVIPDVVVDLREDLDALTSRLHKLKTGSYTQQVQKDVIETLRELIDVIRQELEKRQGGGRGGPQDQQEGDPEEGLLPTSAELKMLRSLQIRVNRRTDRFDRLKEQDPAERERLAKKQSGVGTLTRTMADRLNREDDE